MKETRRIIYITLGSFFLILGAIGIFVPLLPTTPFWLLTCWFYIRSSEKLYNRAMDNRYFGPYIRNYLVDKAIPLRSKIISVAVMWLSAILTSLFLIEYQDSTFEFLNSRCCIFIYNKKALSLPSVREQCFI